MYKIGGIGRIPNEIRQERNSRHMPKAEIRAESSTIPGMTIDDYEEFITLLVLFPKWQECFSCRQ
jgi:hypothetical protein